MCDFESGAYKSMSPQHVCRLFYALDYCEETSYQSLKKIPLMFFEQYKKSESCGNFSKLARQFYLASTMRDLVDCFESHDYEHKTWIYYEGLIRNIFKKLEPQIDLAIQTDFVNTKQKDDELKKENADLKKQLIEAKGTIEMFQTFFIHFSSIMEACKTMKKSK